MYLLNRNESGFSLVQVLVSLALMGVASTAFMNMSQSQVKSKKRLEADMEILSLHTAIARQLLNTQACQHTLAGIVPSEDLALPNGIKDVKGNTKYEVSSTKTYGENIGISEIIIAEVDHFGDPAQPQRDLIISVEFERRAAVLTRRDVATGTTDFTSIKRRFPLTVEVDVTAGSGEVIRCNPDSLIQDIKTEICTDIGGTMDPSNRCQLPDFILRPEVFNGNQCPPGEMLVGFDDDQTVDEGRICEPMPSSNTPNPSACGGTWTPAASSQCSGVPFNQTCSSDNSLQQQATGTQTGGSCASSCTWSSWSGPSAEDTCTGTSAQQTRTNNCGASESRNVSGNKVCCQGTYSSTDNDPVCAPYGYSHGNKSCVDECISKTDESSCNNATLTGCYGSDPYASPTKMCDWVPGGGAAKSCQYFDQTSCVNTSGCSWSP